LTQVETVALWTGLIGGVVSIVLSLVAIVFARDVDRRSERVSTQTIQSLEKIEATVERLSEDTRGLIKVAWDRLLGQVGGSAAMQAGEMSKQAASGLLAELRATLRDLIREEGLGDEATEEVTDVVSAVERELAEPQQGVVRAQSRLGTLRTGAFEAVVESIHRLDPLATEFLRVLDMEKSHLSRKVYRTLLGHSAIGPALKPLS
jgi:hypothetical protein